MRSLTGKLEARKATARTRMEALEAELVRLTARLEGEQEAWSRLRITRETGTEVIMDLGGSGAFRHAGAEGGKRSPGTPDEPGYRCG